jgi:hypothetical protein
MARPIEPTPALRGEDAEKLLATLSTGASEAEMQRREEEARRYVRALESGQGLQIRVRTK